MIYRVFHFQQHQLKVSDIIQIETNSGTHLHI